MQEEANLIYEQITINYLGEDNNDAPRGRTWSDGYSLQPTFIVKVTLDDYNIIIVAIKNKSL